MKSGVTSELYIPIDEPRVIFIATTVETDLGGIARSVPILAKAVADAGWRTTLLAPQCAEPTTEHLDMAGVELAWVARRSDLARQLARRLDTERGPVVVHHAGIWTLANRSVAAVCHARGVPLVVSPRGMLDPWSLSYHAWRKRVAWWLYARRALSRASLVHATSELEASAVRATRVGNPVVVVPNGVMPPTGEWIWPKDQVRRRALFLSRLHPKKGLSLLLEVWAKAQPTGWELMIAGPEDGVEVESLKRQAEELGISENIKWEGAIADGDKWALYRSADLFVLPTLAENFGLVVAEALASGVPVVTTTAAPWSGLVDHRCGWWVEPEAEALVRAMRDAVALSAEERARMGERGRLWVEQAFSWPAIGRQMAEVYRGLVSRR